VVTAFRVQLDCVGHGLIRAYAILTRSASAAVDVVAYYGVSVPAGE
jgi:hypothetical protein